MCRQCGLKHTEQQREQLCEAVSACPNCWGEGILKKHVGDVNVLYRCEAFGGILSDTYKVVIYPFAVISETEDNWFVMYLGKKKRISKWHLNKFAYPAKEDAMKNFKLRSESYVRFLESKLEDAKLRSSLPLEEITREFYQEADSPF